MPASTQNTEESTEDEESARRRTIAERMARLGGIKFGAAPPIPSTRRQQSIPTPTESARQEDETGGGISAEAESERRRAIASRLAGQGQLGRGVFGAPMPTARHEPEKLKESPTEEVEITELSGSEVLVSSPLHSRQTTENEEAPPPVPTRSSRKPTGSSTSPTSPPPLPTSRPNAPTPSRGTHSPISPSPSQMTYTPTPTSAHPRQPSSPPPPVPSKSHPTDYVMIDRTKTSSPASTLSRSTTTATVHKHVPTSTSSATKDSISRSMSSGSTAAAESGWELPSIPAVNFDFDTTESVSSGLLADLGTSVLSEDSTTYPLATSTSGSALALASKSTSSFTRPSMMASREKDFATPAELESLASKFGPKFVNMANHLHTLSHSAHSHGHGNATSPPRGSKSSSGDQTGTSLGFVNKVLGSISDARSPIPYNISPNPNSGLSGPGIELTPFGYPIYSSALSSVSGSGTSIQQGDLIHFTSAHFTGRKGLQSYNISIGSSSSKDGGGGVWGIVSETEKRHMKVKVFLALSLANGGDGGGYVVEHNGYRLDDLKSGLVEVGFLSLLRK